jgi:hypothetical protein
MVVFTYADETEIFIYYLVAVIARPKAVAIHALCLYEALA